MKLEKIRLSNFRCYKTETIIPISNLTALIGKNDSGKSTILEALEIFFNNKIVNCEKLDLAINADDNKIEISCIFSELPDDLIIDSDNPTTLQDEYLLNNENKLEIKKIFPATAAKPKEKIYIICNHPTVENGNDLLTLNRTELRRRADNLGIEQNTYNRNINSSIRHAIWLSLGELNLRELDLLVDKEDTKKVYESIKKYLPLYALFQSDRQSRDDDKEVTDPMKVAIQQALAELTNEIEYIKTEVRNKAIDTANRTLDKLKEMSPELANVLVPEFKAEPKFDSQFKLTINSEDNIPINKRGSGIRRLILLNFFRAEAERKRALNQGNQIIFAFEEPETSQHPDFQEMLIKSFISLSNNNNSQIILTTHTPSIAGLIPLESLRFINNNNGDVNIELGTDEVFMKIADTLGILANPISKNAKALLLLEGKSDITFMTLTAQKLKENGFIPYTFEEKQFALVPIGGCGNLKHWITMRLVEQFEIPYCVLLDSDKGTNEERVNLERVQELRELGVKAYLTRKREPENYINIDCLDLPEGSDINLTDVCDAKSIIASVKHSRKNNVIEDYWSLMTIDQIREVEKYDDNGTDRFEFAEMICDFLTLV